MNCCIQLGFTVLIRTFHLSPHNICTIALINIHYLDINNLRKIAIQSEEIIFILRKSQWQRESLSEHNDFS